MFILAVGLNHRSAPVEVREKLTFPEARLPEALGRLRREAGIAGCAILSTCNRTEVYAATTDMEKGFAALKRFLASYYPMDRGDFNKYFYSYSLYDAIRHLFRVASGLDSMVLGETQILGQVKQAFQTACECGVSNGIINTLFQQAITVGKRVRTDTGIDRMAVSISYAAVELARQIFGNLVGRTVLILGAGKMSELTVKHLVSNGVETVLVSNRSHDRAVELAEHFGGKAIMFDQLYHHMEKADIVISCTAASHYVIHPGPMAQVLEKREGRKVFLIDIAVPRDIDPKVGEIPGVALYDIDDLQNVVDRNLEERRNAAVLAEQIVEQEIDEFLKWLNSLFVVPTIVALKEKGEAIKQKELERVLRKLPGLSDKEKKIVGSLANSIVNQLLHDPVVQIRRYAATHQGHLYSEVLQNLFNLEVQGQMTKAPVEDETAVGNHP